MMMMARICFDADKAELGIAALRAQGYEVLTHTFPDEPDYVFAEAMRNENGDAFGCDMLDDVDHIIGPFGSVSDAGVIPAGHVPFEYETAAWRGVTTD